MLGSCLYVKQFAGNLKGVRGQPDYIQECGVNCLHLIPLPDTVDSRRPQSYTVFQPSTDILREETVSAGTEIWLKPGEFRWMVSETG